MQGPALCRLILPYLAELEARQHGPLAQTPLEASSLEECAPTGLGCAAQGRHAAWASHSSANSASPSASASSSARAGDHSTHLPITHEQLGDCVSP